MKILFVGTRCAFDRLNAEGTGQLWDMHFLEPGKEIVDYRDCHSFQAAILEIGLSTHDEKRAGLALRSMLDVPVTIGLSAQYFDICGLEIHPSWVDVILADVQSTKLLKSQCDALIRLAHKLASEDLVSGDVTLRTDKQTVLVNGSSLSLQPRQYQLLELLFVNQGKTVTTDMFFNHVYGWDEPPSPKILDVLICGLRRKLREAGSESECIETRWGQGYAIKTHSTYALKAVA